jgi:UDP-N-acetylglucosamine--N-acetylmuramyl-(pentapeptide) pyrophosphoryl-undecaprenol N-acetylglucosamine transferase
MYGRFERIVHVLNSPRIDRGGIPAKLALPFRALKVFFQSRNLLESLEPDLVFATGGYSSFFVMAAARSMGIKSVLHDSNSIPGRSNRLASRFAASVMLGFHCAERFFPGKGVYTGNPVRDSLRHTGAEEARRELGLDSSPIVLFLGGSQGARSVNDLANAVSKSGVSVILQCGERDFSRMRELTRGRNEFVLTGFVDDPSLLYSAADLCVARSGALTIAELCWFRLPAVFIPYPHAADDHQTANAREIASIGGATVIQEGDATPDRLMDELRQLLGNPEELAAMSRSLADYMPLNPSVRIAEDLLELAIRRSL